ncbi:LLM class flavin-dependent oxidoreductase [Nocardia salmonicida]|uniref:LLM class flavin-dependent oxidoreductase n=1 Tax=Nocardia salmonicida TaxID=53431 RepID=UPI00366B7A19
MRDQLRFGVFYAPYHPTDRNPTLQIRRLISMAQHLDEIGFDEVWCGEHHSQGVEIIGSPEVLLAAMAERTERIKLGTGVMSLPWHNPLIAADRICQLDHQSRGRVIFGTGPGKTAVDSYMFGQDQSEQRRMQDEALTAIVPLLRGEVVNMETDWFKLVDARLHLLPFQHKGIEVVAASTASPSGPSLAGKHGLSMLSLAAGDPAGFNALDANWDIYEKVAAHNGHGVDRKTWRLVSPMFLAETTEEAHRAVRNRVTHMGRYLEKNLGTEFEWARTPEATIEQWTTEGVPGFGKAVIGTPDKAIKHIQALVEKTGGFGAYMINAWDIAEHEEMKRSFELFASEVMPAFHRSNIGREASLDFLGEHSKALSANTMNAVQKARADYYGEGGNKK